VTPDLTLLSRVAYRGQDITAPRLRGLLALLATDLHLGCSVSRLVEGIWPEEQPEYPTRALHVLVSRARAQLGTEVIASTPTGYRLALRDDQVDVTAVLLSASASAKYARSGDHEAALAHAEAGLALFQGTTDNTLDDPVSTLRAERASTRRSLVRARAMALSRLGRHAEAVEALTELVQERPRDEELLLELLRCEAMTLGPSAALSRYDAYRRQLRDDLGTDPGPALQAMQQQLLQGDVPIVRHGVAHEPNPLLGRADDIAAVATLLRKSRVTSIVGAGGLGKTRLAHAVSRQAEQRLVLFVGLVGVTRDEDVAGEVASVLGIADARRGFAVPTDMLTVIVGALGSGPTLLVLDNCEHVIRGVAELVQALVSMTKDLRVLTTSRAALGLSSESLYPLPELSLGTSVQLFEQRARAARPGIELPPDVVASLCRKLDGLPLAVELAAARVRVMSVAEIAQRLDDRFALLRGGTRDAPERHHTLRGVVDWSWNLLDPAGQAALRALSVFPGGFTEAAARQVTGDSDVLQVLTHLIDQSLLKVVDAETGSRFRMLETVREFSAERRDAARETDAVLGRFLDWARDFGFTHHHDVMGSRPFTYAELVRAEQDNLILALRHGLDREDGPAVTATAAVLMGLWTLEANYGRVVALAEDIAWLLSHYRPEPELVEAARTTATLSTANAFLLQGARPVRSLVTLRRLPGAPPDTLIRAMAIVLRALSEPGRSAEQTLPALCDSPEPLVAGVANGVASYVLETRLDQHGALKAAERMLEAFTAGGSPWWRIMSHIRISELSLQLDDAANARRQLLTALRALESWPDVAGIRYGLVLANLQLGEVDEAEHWMDLAMDQQADERPGGVTFKLGAWAEILIARGETEAGLRMWRRAADQLYNAEPRDFPVGPHGTDLWMLELVAITVVAHAQAGRLDLVSEIVADLPHRLTKALEHPLVDPPPYVMDTPAVGALLLALAMVDLERDPALAARMIALAECFRYSRAFHPTMSGARTRRTAEIADKSAYIDALDAYAGLDRDGLRAVALHMLGSRA
jgi:predicted ATPase/DNA-binding SARP family transcriptional activator